MKITAIEIGKIAIPLKTPFITALRRVDVAEDLVVKVHTDDGHTGYGNAPATVVITGDSHQSVAAAIKYTIGPKLIGRDIDDREDILDTIHQSMVHNTSAKAALDMAVHDLFCPCTASSAAARRASPRTSPSASTRRTRWLPTPSRPFLAATAT